MEEIILEVEPREELRRVKVKLVRNAKFIPAVIYVKGKESLPIKVLNRDLLRLIHEHRVESAVINVKLKDDKKAKSRPCLIKELQHDPVTDNIIHVDFNEISLTKAIKVNVPVIAKGEPVGVKQEGGALEHILWEIEVECLPTEIPEEIEIDVSALKIGDSVHVKDLKISSNIKVINDPESIIVTVSAPMKEEVAAPVEGEEKPELEVIKEKKEVPGEGKEAKEGKESKEEGKEKK
ncbi:50S ribosomal protein L25 [bacterium]|nr:MAG: 50S ribosomal protein L25 [bacterium]